MNRAALTQLHINTAGPFLMVGGYSSLQKQWSADCVLKRNMNQWDAAPRCQGFDYGARVYRVMVGASCLPWRYHCTLPNNKATTTSLNIRSKTPCEVVRL